MQENRYPIWVLEATNGANKPFVGVVLSPDGSVYSKSFARREDAQSFTEETVRDLMMAPGERRNDA